MEIIQRKSQINKNTITRMAMYYRVLRNLNNNGISIVSSGMMESYSGIGAATIRKDLSCFGEFGRKGIGYQTGMLSNWIGKILGYENNWNTALVGVGVPLMSVSHYFNFMPPGFQLVALFDVDESYKGQAVPETGLVVESLTNLEKIIASRRISIGLLAVTAEYVQHVTNRLVKAGICALGNFSPVHTTVPDNMPLVQMNFSDGLSQLSYQLNRNVDPETLLEYSALGY